MMFPRFRNRHRQSKRFLTGMAAALVAASAVALGDGGVRPRQGEAPHAGRAAMALGGAAGSRTAGGPRSAEHGARAPHGGGGADSSEDRDVSEDRDAFGPNGENDVMALADYAAAVADRADDVHGDGPAGGEPGLAGAEPFQTAGADLGPGALGFGFVGGGSGGGGGSAPGGGGGYSGGGEPGGTVPTPNPDESPPTGTVPTPPAVDDGHTDPVCVLSSGCNLAPPGAPAPPQTTDFGGGGDLPGDLAGELPPRGHPGGGDAVAVPEPQTWLMLLAGFMGLGVALRARRRRAALT